MNCPKCYKPKAEFGEGRCPACHEKEVAALREKELLWKGPPEESNRVYLDGGPYLPALYFFGRNRTTLQKYPEDDNPAQQNALRILEE